MTASLELSETREGARGHAIVGLPSQFI